MITKPSKPPTTLLQKISQKKFQLLLLLVLILAAFLRFYNYNNRWDLGNDNSRDIAIAKEAISRRELPSIGSFSSAGPFVFGPLFYWIIMTSYLLLPFIFSAPIIITILAGISTVAILATCGYLIAGKRLALIIAILAATSPQLVIRSVVLGQHTYVAITTSLLFLTFILYWQRQKLIYPFLMGLSLGAALNLHYQSINLLIFFAAVFCIPNINLKKRISGFLLMTIGFLIPSAPLIIWDSQQNWANLRNILDYLLIGQYRLYVPNSWKLFLFHYLPSYWSFLISGSQPIALFLMLLTFITTSTFILKKLLYIVPSPLRGRTIGARLLDRGKEGQGEGEKIRAKSKLPEKKIKLPMDKNSEIMVIFSIIFAILLLVNRFYKGERSEGYLLYLAPFILLFTAWSIDQLFQLKTKKNYKLPTQITATLILIILLWGNINQAIKYEQLTTIKPQIEKTANFLMQKYPNTKFAIYDYLTRSSSQSQPLSLILKLKNKTDPHGMPIGHLCKSKECLKKLPKITTLGDTTLVDMRSVKNKDQKQSNWVKVNQENMYDDLIGWSKKHQLKSTFSLWGYLSAKFK